MVCFLSLTRSLYNVIIVVRQTCRHACILLCTVHNYFLLHLQPRLFPYISLIRLKLRVSFNETAATQPPITRRPSTTNHRSDRFLTVQETRRKGALGGVTLRKNF